MSNQKSAAQELINMGDKIDSAIKVNGKSFKESIIKTANQYLETLEKMDATKQKMEELKRNQ